MAKMPVYAGMVFGKTAKGGADMPRRFACDGGKSSIPNITYTREDRLQTFWKLFFKDYGHF